MANKCSHTTDTQVDHGYEDYDGNWVEDIRTEGKSTCIDIDTHRYKCTQCNLVMYYSSAAQNHYENGASEPIVEFGIMAYSHNYKDQNI